MSDEPSALRSLLTPDAIAGVVLAVGASLVTALQTKVSGLGVLVSNLAAVLLVVCIIPLAQSKGYGWGDWLYLICLGAGLTSWSLFMFATKVADRLLRRSDDIADRAIDRVIGPDKSEK